MNAVIGAPASGEGRYIGNMVSPRKRRTRPGRYCALTLTSHERRAGIRAHSLSLTMQIRCRRADISRTYNRHFLAHDVLSLQMKILNHEGHEVSERKSNPKSFVLLSVLCFFTQHSTWRRPCFR